MIRIITIEREYVSGAASIAENTSQIAPFECERKTYQNSLRGRPKPCCVFRVSLQQSLRP